MQQSRSYVLAVGVIVALAYAIWLMSSQHAAFPGLRTVGLYKYEAVPVGSDGPLKDCVVCHSIEPGGALRVAPPLHSVVGARKARYEWYTYSDALRKAGGTWTESDLDKFLTSPSRFLPGTTKTILGYPDAERRADIIAALKKAL